MKYLSALLVFLAFTLLHACSLDFNPPPILNATPAVQASQAPVFILATPTLTAVPTTETLPAPTETTPPETATETPLAPISTPENPVLTLEQLRNATLTIKGSDQNERTFTLKDGRYENGSDPAQPGYISISLGEKTAFGDLNADGIADAAVILIESFGGTGEFVSIAAILNHYGQPLAAASALIEDRALVNEIAIRDAEIFVDATIHGPNDPMCCASVPSKRLYHLNNDSLTLSQLSTTTPTGQERVIQIDSPANGSEIGAPFVIQGSVSISPFENTLVYSIFAVDASNPLEHAGFTISADGLGGPGTFELPIDPAKYNLSGPVWIVIADLSAADGSTLALDSVYLTFK
jgi:hypothetical protein